MKQFSDLLLKILLIIKLLATALVLAFPQAFITWFLPLGIFSPFLVGAMAYADVPKELLILLVILVVISTISLVVFSICSIISHKCCSRFAYLLIVCYLLETLAYFLTLIFGSIAFGKVAGIVFNAIVVKLLWSHRKTGR